MLLTAFGAVGCSSSDKCGVVAVDDHHITGTLTFAANRYQPERKEDIDTTYVHTTSGIGGAHTFEFAITTPPPVSMKLTMPYLPYDYQASATEGASLCLGQNACEGLSSSKILSQPETACTGPDSVSVYPCAQSFDLEFGVRGEYFEGTLHLTQKEHVKQCDE